MIFRSKPGILLCCTALAWAVPGFCWGPEGHRVVGVEAFALLDDTARAEVVEILGGDSAEAIDEACSWPDTVRETAEWKWIPTTKLKVTITVSRVNINTLL